MKFALHRGVSGVSISKEIDRYFQLNFRQRCLISTGNELRSPSLSQFDSLIQFQRGGDFLVASDLTYRFSNCFRLFDS